MKKAILLSVLTAAVIGALLVWFFSTHHQEEKQVFTGYKGEARHNYLLAAERFAQKLGHDAYSEAELQPGEWMPAPQDTLFLFTGRTHYSAEDNEQLLGWVDQGGHLFVAANSISDENDPILAAIGVSTESRYDQDDEEDDSQDNSDQDDADVEQDGGNNVDEDTVIDTDFALRLKSEQTPVTYSDRHGVVVARESFGDGLITVLADHDFFHNRAFARLDHAYFFQQLTTEVGEPGIYWFIYGTGRRNLWQLISDEAPYFLGFSGILLILFLWHRGQRFGPLLAQPRHERRSLLEHIRAAGFFQWRHRSHRTLLEGAQQDLLKKFSRWHPGIHRLNTNEQSKLIQSHIDSDETLTQLALGTYSAKDFVRQIDAIQTIRNQL